MVWDVAQLARALGRRFESCRSNCTSIASARLELLERGGKGRHMERWRTGKVIHDRCKSYPFRYAHDDGCKANSQLESIIAWRLEAKCLCTLTRYHFRGCAVLYSNLADEAEFLHSSVVEQHTAMCGQVFDSPCRNRSGRARMM